MTAAPEWQTRVGDIWAAEWRRTDRSFADLGRQLDAAILALAPDTGHAVDLGSGAGATSIALAAARPGLAVHGIDLSEPLVTVARARAADRRLANLSFSVGAVPAALAGHGSIDLAVSRHGVMFFDDPIGAFHGIAAALAPGAPLVFSCFRKPQDNPWAAETIAAIGGELSPPNGYAPGPFSLADRETITGLLAAAGFGDVSITAADYSYCAGGGPDPASDAADFFQKIGPVARAIAEAPGDRRAAMIDRLRTVLTAHIEGERVAFPAAAWLVSARTARRAP